MWEIVTVHYIYAALIENIARLDVYRVYNMCIYNICEPYADALINLQVSIVLYVNF